MPKFQDKLNKTLCLVKALVGGYVVGKKNGEDILIPNNNGEMEVSCNINDTNKYKYFTESMVYHTPEEYEVGDKLLIPDVGEYYVVDVGYQEDDGEIQYLIAR